MKRQKPATALMARILTLLLACWMLFPQSIYAEIYSYVDKNGVMHFTNTPTANKYSSTKYRYIGNEFSRLRYMRISKPFTRINCNAYDDIIRKACNLHGIKYELIKAIIHAESSFNPNAVSPAGACGLMQLMPDNIEKFNVNDPFDPHENIMAGTKFFRQLLDRYDSDLKLTLAAYNAGPGAVDQYRGIPPYPETEDYVSRVLHYYNNYKN
ncbi:MAG: lytic transglycosylase domain-containing protein [Desulfobacterales bacterium]|nr:lytic transglycosylase domain-containing protein [Desulfobacterales bacterium]